MVANRVKSELIGKLGNVLRKAHEEHKNDETELSNFGELPAGIDNGIAQLVECKFSQYKEGDKKGKFFFYAAGVVLRPTMHDDIPIEGLRTNIMEPLCDTPNNKRKTISEHLGWIYNQLRLLGIDTTQVEVEDIEAVCEALKEAKPCFRFRTWKGKKQTTGQYANQEPRTQHTWNGIVEFDTSGDAEGVEDESATVSDEPDEDSEEAVAPAKVAPKTKPPVRTATGANGKPAAKGNVVAPARDAAKAGKGKPPFNEFEEEETEGVEDGEIDSGNEEDEQEVGQEDTEASEAEEEEGGEVPTVGDATYYAPVDPKTKKPVRKAIECEVVSVDEKRGECTIKSLVNGTLFKRVKISDLRGE